MLSKNIRRHLAQEIMTILPETPEPGFNTIYTLIPSGGISCELSVLAEISNRGFEEGNRCGYLEIEISRTNNSINFHAHSIFYYKNKSKTPSTSYEEDHLSLLYVNNNRKSKEHSLFYYQQYNLKPEIDCYAFLQELKRTDDYSSYDMQNKNIYQQIRVSIIHNTKELIIAFHDSYQNLKIYKA